MIYDLLENAATYRPLGEKLALGFRYLAQFDPATPDGRVLLDGENVFALVQSYVPTPAVQRMFEAHIKYADLQFIAEGEEIIQYAPLGSLRETKADSAADDGALYAGSDEFPLFMQTGRFPILFPADGHKPGCFGGSPIA